MPSKNLALSRIDKDELKDLQIFFNQKIVATINTLDGSTLGDNLNTNHQVDYMSSALIPAEVKKMTKNTFHLVAIW